MKNKKFIITFLIMFFISIFSRTAFAQEMNSVIENETFKDMISSGELVYRRHRSRNSTSDI